MTAFSKTRSITGIVILLACVLTVFVIQRGRDGSDPAHPPATAAKESDAVSTDPGVLLASLSSRSGPAAMRESLAGLRAALLAMPPAEAIAWINARLKEGTDVPTGLEFLIGGDQGMKEWPTLRVFLLDVLLSIDPGAAAQAGRGILETFTSPDEWALAMRNVARGSTAEADMTLLKSKAAEMLHHTAWRENPSAGYLEAFDVIVHTRHTGLAPELLACTAEKDRKAVRHAAFLTLDRLVQAEPAQVLAQLTADASTHPESGLMISNMVARADVRDPAQRQQVEAWLKDAKRTAAELAGFAGVFPNANQMVSNNLITRVATFQAADLAVQDRASLAVVNAWLSDPAFSRSHELLRSTRQRLEEFVK